jgi:hypothetical protein
MRDLPSEHEWQEAVPNRIIIAIYQIAKGTGQVRLEGGGELTSVLLLGRK